MTADEIGMMLNLRATLSEYEHFMTHLSLMIEKGADIPLGGTLSFPMKDKLYKQVRDLVVGSEAMAADAVRGQLFAKVRDMYFDDEDPTDDGK